MTNGMLVQIYLAIFSIVSIGNAFRSFAIHRMIETIELWWGIFSITMLAVSFIPDFFYWCNAMQLWHVVMLMLAATICFMILFQIFKTVSILVNQNRELAMQVSLLNQENEQLMIKLGIIPDRYKEKTIHGCEEENTVRN